uniref:Uncharacterized protein n=1 Tax=Parascaris univalens TaxID=6257 RepID=A0A914ZWR3_PARUN
MVQWRFPQVACYSLFVTSRFHRSSQPTTGKYLDPSTQINPLKFRLGEKETRFRSKTNSLILRQNGVVKGVNETSTFAFSTTVKTDNDAVQPKSEYP